MSAIVTDNTRGNAIEIELTGKLTDADYQRFVPLIDARIEQDGKISMLIVLTDFHGWDAAALWDDIKWNAKHFDDVARIAFVGDRQWEKGMAAFCRPFTSAKVKYFDLSQLNEARAWASA